MYVILYKVLNFFGVLLFFIVYVVNEVGVSVLVICKLEIFDMIVFGGRMLEVFRLISNFWELKGLVIVYEDLFIEEVFVVVGYGKDVWGE